MEGKRVQELAVQSDTIPPEFIRTEDEQPALTTFHGDNLPEVPVIDFGCKDEDELVKSILKASTEWGFFQIINHDIPTELIADFKKVGQEFFELPQEEKEVYAKPPDAKSVEGYGTFLQKEVDGKKGWVDHLFHRLAPPSAINYKFWPKNPSNYREVTEQYEKHLQSAVDLLLRRLSKALGLSEDQLRSAAGGDELVYLLKINYYPPCPRPDLALGVPAHTDMSVLTVLVPNEVQGLQVHQDGHWIDVKYIPNALVIHVGDQLEILSNGKLKAVLHRTTVNKEKARMSWPVFIEPPQEAVLGPHAKLVSDQNPPKYKTKKYCDYVYCKLNKIPQ